MTASRPLSLMTLIQIREVARDVWISQGGDVEAAEREFTRRYPGAHQLAAFYDITQHWIDRKIDVPSVVMDEAEAEVLGLETDYMAATEATAEVRLRRWCMPVLRVCLFVVRWMPIPVTRKLKIGYAVCGWLTGKAVYVKETD